LVGGPFGSDLTRSDYIETPGVPVIRGTNLGGRESRFIDDGFVFVTPEKADSLRRNMAFPGDLIFTQRGTMGQVAIIPSNCKFPRYVISQSQMKLTPNVNRVDRLYLYHYLRSPLTLNRLLSQTQATGVPHINLGILRDFTVLLPPLPEQRRIAAILDQADGLRRKRQQALALTDQLATSMFREMFGNCDSRKGRWATSSVGNAVNLANGRAFKSSEWRKEGLPIIRIQNLKDADAEFNYFDGEFADQHFVEPGSLLIAWAGQLVSF
jgi:type I restriction enzyme S subunit